MIQLYSKQGVNIKHLLVPLIRSTPRSSHPAAFFLDCRQKKIEKKKKSCNMCTASHKVGNKYTLSGSYFCPELEFLKRVCEDT